MLLKDFFTDNPNVALAFSGGVDSTFLLYCALKHAKNVTAYYVKTEFQPQFEMEDVLKFAQEYNANLKVINVEMLKNKDIVSNPKNRCYYCKKLIFNTIKECAKSDGYDIVIEGTNASDDIDDRPGYKALVELGVKSPLKECNLTKKQIYSLSKQAGLFTANKPPYACLATRIKTDEKITKEKLKKTEWAEGYLRKLGYEDIRVRLESNRAKIQVKYNDFDRANLQFEEIKKELLKKYDDVILDSEVKR